MWPKRHFRARVEVRSAENGGRRSALNLYSYRPDLSFSVDKRAYYGAHAIPEGQEQPCDVWIEPGATFDSDFWIRSAAVQIMARLLIGSEFKVMEGGRAVGDGIVTEIYRIDD